MNKNLIFGEEKQDLGVDERYWDPVIVEKASASGSELVDLGDDRLEGKLVADPTYINSIQFNRI